MKFMLFAVHAMPTTLQLDHSEVPCVLRDAEWHDRRQQNGPPFRPSAALARDVPILVENRALVQAGSAH